MYLPAMLLFPFLYVVTAFKFLILLQLLIAGTATYAFGRVLGFGSVAALLSAIVYEFGPFLVVQTDCCTVAGQLSTWVPVAFLGVELALRARNWVYRSAAWFLAGLAISQMVSGWVGQGAVNGMLILAGWVGYQACPGGNDRANDRDHRGGDRRRRSVPASRRERPVVQPWWNLRRHSRRRR
jgi:hypothetical protein